MASTDEPKRGEIWLTALGSSRPGEPKKTRPTIVLTPPRMLLGSPRELIIVLPVSASAAPSDVRPRIPSSTGLDRDSVALPRAIRGLARGRLIEKIGELSPDQLTAVEDSLAYTLGFATA